MNHYPRHVGDFIGATIGLTLMERGAYSALLDRYYMDESPLPLERAEVYRMAACTTAAERKAVDYVLVRYFIEKADGWHQKRADCEIAKYQERSDSAKRSINTRWANRNTNVSDSNAERTTNQEPVTKNQEPIPSGTGLREVPTTEAASLPGTLTPATWTDWRAHLANRGKPMTPQGERLQLAQLRGHADPETIVQNAIRNGHLRLEPVGGWPDKATSIHEKRAATAAAMYGTTTRDDHEEPTDITGESQRIA